MHFTGSPGTDIILASYAQKHCADVLSHDEDLMMFKGATYKVYKSVVTTNEGFLLEENQKNPKKTSIF